MTVTMEQALRMIAERYPCDCEVVRETTSVKVRPGTCRTKWPAQPSEWCAHCLATDALEGS